MDNIDNTKEKIILPKNLQREMIKFFLKTSMPKLAMLNKQEAEQTQDKEQQTPKIQNKGC